MHLQSKLRAMKMLSCLLTIFCLEIGARGHSQRITIQVEQTPLEKVFQLVEAQAQVSFIYSREDLLLAQPVTLHLKNEPLDVLLNKCFQYQPLQYSLDGRFIIVRAKKATDKPARNTPPLKGRVVNEQGEPIAGISISIRDGSMATITNEQGEFDLPASGTSIILVISGAEITSREITVTAGTYQTITVNKKVGTLDETVLIAYGKTTRRLSTGSVASIKAEKIAQQPVSNPLTALTGRITGLRVTQGSGAPGSYVTVRLRGQNSIANGNDPLYIVDGVPFPSEPMSTIGGAGITTSPLNNINPLDIESIEVLKDADATAIYGSRAANGAILITTKKGRAGTTHVNVSVYTGFGKITRGTELLTTPDYLRMRKEGYSNDGTTPTIANGRDLLVWDSTWYTDWQKVVIANTSHLLDINTSFSGGGQQTQFLIGGGYHKETTVFPGDFGEEKFSANAGISHNSLDNRLKIDFKASYVHTNNILPTSDLTGLLATSPNTPAIYDSLGRLNWENNTWINPLAGILKKQFASIDNLVVSNTIRYRVAKGLEVKTAFGYTDITDNERSTNPRASFIPSSTMQASAIFENLRIKTTIIEPQVNYTTKICGGELSVVTGASFQTSLQKGSRLSAEGYSSDELLNSLSGAATVRTVTERNSRYRYFGVFARVNYNLEKKYLLTFTGRRDGSSRYGPENRFANFGSIGAGWIFSEEGWMKKHISAISFGKIKASIGTTGNDQIGDYKYYDLYSPYTSTYQNTTPLYPQQLFNPDFGWEQVRKAELGLDLGFFKDRVLLNLAYYNNITTNQLVAYGLPSITGFSSVLMNIPARIRNSGIEVELNTVNIKRKFFKWTSSFNITIPENKLLAYENLESSTYANTYVVGKSLFIAKRYHFAGMDPATGIYTFTDFDQDGKISAPNDQQDIVYTGQQYFGGMEQVFSYKNLELSLFFQYVRVKHTANYLSSFARPGSMANQPTVVMTRWQKPGDMTDVQKFSAANAAVSTAFSLYRQSDASLTDGSFGRLKTVYLSWRPVIRQLGERTSCTFFAQAQNLFTITNYNYLDPETRLSLPPSKIVTLGFKLSL